MNWLIDAQLPHHLADLLNRLDQNAVHTIDLPEANRTSDSDVCQIADAEDRIIITKDRDFVDSHLIAGTPTRLLWVKTGNISNNALLTLFETRLIDFESAFSQVNFAELTKTNLILHQQG